MKPYKRVVEFTFDTDFSISLTLMYNLSQKGKISESKGYKEYCDYYLLPKTGTRKGAGPRRRNPTAIVALPRARSPRLAIPRSEIHPKKGVATV